MSWQPEVDDPAREDHDVLGMNASPSQLDFAVQDLGRCAIIVRLAHLPNLLSDLI